MDMNKVREIVKDLTECFDGQGVPNMMYVKYKIDELDRLANSSSDIQNVSKCFSEEDMLKEYSRGFNHGVSSNRIP